MSPIVDPLFYLAAVPAVLIAGVSKGGFGGGVAILAVPLMALVIGPVQAAAIMLPILCAMDVFGLIAYRRHGDWPNLRRMLPGAFAGIAVGAVTFRWLDADAVRLLVGGLALGFVGYSLVGARRAARLAETPVPIRPHAGLGGLAGAAAGFTSFVAHAGGPPVQLYLLPQRPDKTAFVGTTVWFFFAVNYLKLGPYAYLGLFSAENLDTALVLAPLAPLGIWLGVKLHGLVREALFYRVVYALLTVTGLKLTWDGIAGLTGLG